MQLQWRMGHSEIALSLAVLFRAVLRLRPHRVPQPSQYCQPPHSFGPCSGPALYQNKPFGVYYAVFLKLSVLFFRGMLFSFAVLAVFSIASQLFDCSVTGNICSVMLLRLFILSFRRKTRAVCILKRNLISCFPCPQFVMNGELCLTCLILKVSARFPWTTSKWPLTAENSSPTFLLGKSLSSRLLEIVSR